MPSTNKLPYRASVEQLNLTWMDRYREYDLDRPPSITFDEDKHRYTLDGHFVPSVTQIIKAQDPFEAGPWWGMRVAISAIARLVQQGELSYATLLAEDFEQVLLGKVGRIEPVVVENKLSTNHVRQDRAEEGIAIHFALEQIATGGGLPTLSDFDPELRGFIQAFSGWYVDQDPDPAFHEVILASRDRLYAGRTDFGKKVWDVERDQPGVELVDYKTSRRDKGPKIYDSYMLQNTGYLEAFNEMLRWQPIEAPRAVEASTVVLHDSGSYLRETTLCTPGRWEAAVALWWENEPFLDALATRRNKSGKRRAR